MCADFTGELVDRSGPPSQVIRNTQASYCRKRIRDVLAEHQLHHLRHGRRGRRRGGAGRLCVHQKYFTHQTNLNAKRDDSRCFGVQEAEGLWPIKTKSALILRADARQKKEATIAAPTVKALERPRRSNVTAGIRVVRQLPRSSGEISPFFRSIEMHVNRVYSDGGSR